MNLPQWNAVTPRGQLLLAVAIVGIPSMLGWVWFIVSLLRNRDRSEQ